MTRWMGINDLTLVLLLLGGAMAASMILLRAIGSGSHTMAQHIIDQRREQERQQLLSSAIAEATGRAAALEPLALNADGTIAEPILGLVEKR